MLPELTRVMWTSAAARAVWAPRVQAVSQAWQAAELASVEHGLRPACLQTVAPDGLPALSAKAAAVGLVALPIARQASTSCYGNASQPLVEGQPWDYRVAVTQPHVAEFVARAWAAQRDEDLGALLGYPACCRAFFQRVWVDQGCRDTTWAMDQTPGPPEANILLRWVGVRLVPHLPCGFACPETVRQGRAYAAMLPAAERAWALDLLGWPMRWTARHGVAELETPCFKINMDTDSSPELREVRRDGTPPPEGATGIRFPYAQPCAETPIRLVDRREWTANGFASKEAMDAGHQMILDVLQQSPPNGADDGGDVYDLGAGNGQLVRKIQEVFPGLHVRGYECDSKKIAGHPDVYLRDLRDLLTTVPFRRHDTFVVSIRRFEEIPGLEDWCLTHARQVLVYSYDAPMMARWYRVEVPV